MCDECVNNLITLYKFRQKCQISNDFLFAKSKICIPKYIPQEIIPIRINTDPPEEDSDNEQYNDVIEIVDDGNDNDEYISYTNGDLDNYSQSSGSQNFNESKFTNGGLHARSNCYADNETGEIIGSSINCGWMGYESEDDNQTDSKDNESDEQIFSVDELNSQVNINGLLGEDELTKSQVKTRIYDCMYCGMKFPSKWKQSIHMCPRKPKYKTGARDYTKKTKRKYTPQTMANAMNEVRLGNDSIYRIAQKYGIPKNTLIYRAQKSGHYQPPPS